ncbi:Uncharacterised protein [Mycobacteroides abscessus]|nr:Uncharacterised protein [Mycobacteroides abscessus]
MRRWTAMPGSWRRSPRSSKLVVNALAPTDSRNVSSAISCRAAYRSEACRSPSLRSSGTTS